MFLKGFCFHTCSPTVLSQKSTQSNTICSKLQILFLLQWLHLTWSKIPNPYHGQIGPTSPAQLLLISEMYSSLGPLLLLPLVLPHWYLYFLSTLNRHSSQGIYTSCFQSLENGLNSSFCCPTPWLTLPPSLILFWPCHLKYKPLRTASHSLFFLPCLIST